MLGAQIGSDVELRIDADLGMILERCDEVAYRQFRSLFSVLRASLGRLSPQDRPRSVTLLDEMTGAWIMALATRRPETFLIVHFEMPSGAPPNPNGPRSARDLRGSFPILERSTFIAAVGKRAPIVVDRSIDGIRISGAESGAEIKSILHRRIGRSLFVDDLTDSILNDDSIILCIYMEVVDDKRPSISPRISTSETIAMLKLYDKLYDAGCISPMRQSFFGSWRECPSSGTFGNSACSTSEWFEQVGESHDWGISNGK